MDFSRSKVGIGYCFTSYRGVFTPHETPHELFRAAQETLQKLFHAPQETPKKVFRAAR